MNSVVLNLLIATLLLAANAFYVAAEFGAVGVRRMIPLLAIGGVALGLMAGQRERKREAPADSD